MPPSNASAVRRRLDLKSMRPAGGGPEILAISLVDDADQDHIDASGLCELPAPTLALGTSGIDVEKFLDLWRGGVPNLDAPARAYGRNLYRCLFEESPDLRKAWHEAIAESQSSGRGLRLEIRCPIDTASHWMGQRLSALPFELMCDARGYLFRRPGWSTVRRSQGLRSRVLRLASEDDRRPRVQVAWANVARPSEPALDERLFLAHDEAVQRLAQQAQAERLAPLPAATRRALRDKLEGGRPHVLVWVGHGLDSGSGLLLHDDEDPVAGCVVSATDFAAVVREGQVDVALLWSCHGAGTFRPYDVGVAEALLDPERGDVAAVVASFSSLDAHAVARLSARLIETWGHAESDLEAALSRARAELDEASLNWARPVLFLRTPPAAPDASLVRRAVTVTLPVARPGRLRWLPFLPAHTAHYVDRHSRLERLREDVAHHPIVVLEGLAGVGKTELALAFAHGLRAADEDVAFVDLSGQRSLGTLRQTLGLLVRDQPFDDEVQLFAALANRRWTLVLDNAEDVLHDAALRDELLALLIALRQAGPQFRAVVTSRHALARKDTHEAQALFTREWRLLDIEESRQLFVAAASLRLAPAQATSAVLDPLMDDLGGIARAIVLMAGQLGDDVDVPELRRRLAHEGAEAIVEEDLYGENLPSTLDGRFSKSRLSSALRLSLASAIRQVPLASDLFDVLGTLPGGLLQSLLPNDAEGRLTDALIALLNHHLVQLSGDDRRIVMAAPVRDFAWRRREAGTAVVVASLLDGIQRSLAAHARNLVQDFGTENSRVAWLQFLPEASNLVQLLAVRVDSHWTSDDDIVSAAAFSGLRLFAEHGGTARATLATLEPLASKFLARSASSWTAASVQFDLGLLRLRADNLDSARAAFERALTVFGQNGDRSGVANTCVVLGHLKQRTADLEEAGQLYEQASSIYRELGDRLGEANTLLALGELRQRRDEVPAARQACEQALPIYRQIGARLGEANTLRTLGTLLQYSDDLDGAKHAYEQALEIFRKIDVHLGMANVLHALGGLKLRLEDLVGAKLAYEQALPIFDQIDEQLGKANSLCALGDLLMRTGDLASAADAYDRALPIYQRIGASMGEATVYQAKGDLLQRRDDLGGARQAYDRALRISRKIGARLTEANTLASLGDLNRRYGDYSGAAQAYEQSLSIYRTIGDQLGLANALSALGIAKMYGNKDPIGAGQAFDEALAIFRRIGQKLGQANTLQVMGQLALLGREPARSFGLTLQALEIQRVVGDQLGSGGTHGCLSQAAAAVGAIPLAIGLAGRAFSILGSLDSRFGQMKALYDLGRELLSSNPGAGLACLFEAEVLAQSVGDSLSDQINSLMRKIQSAANGNSEFAALLTTVQEHASEIVRQLFAKAEAAVAAGELDLYTFPKSDDEPADEQ